MEISFYHIAKEQFTRILGLLLLVLCMHLSASAQPPDKIYTVKDGKMYIELSRDIPVAELDSFINLHELHDLFLKEFLLKNIPDSLVKRGWEIEKNARKYIAISKPLFSTVDLNNLVEQIIFTGKDPSIDAMFPSENSNIVYGTNRFKNKLPFDVKDSLVTFYLRNNQKARQVMLAGSFNGWSTDNLPMLKTDSGWIANVKLSPGKYWYKFIADGDWMVDNDNRQNENDGQGNTNSVFFKANHVFKLAGHTNAKKVYIAGKFNDWREKELLMNKTADGWELPLYLAEGTHTYRFIADGRWFEDAANPDRLPNEYGEYNSVIRLGKPYVFVLNGFNDAQKVWLTGSFNGWRKDELLMTKTPDGWMLPYNIGAGNYEYRFVVDGKEMTDPDNPVFTARNRADGNSWLVIAPNHTFCLKGYQQAKAVYLAGGFNSFSPDKLLMKKTEEGWECNVHLSIGKHLYKFVVDGEWIRDPENPLWEDNEFHTGDSVIWKER